MVYVRPYSENLAQTMKDVDTTLLIVHNEDTLDVWMYHTIDTIGARRELAAYYKLMGITPGRCVVCRPQWTGMFQPYAKEHTHATAVQS